LSFSLLLYSLTNPALSIAMFSSIIFALALGGSNVVFAATTSYASRPTFSTIQPALSSIRAAQATATPLSPVSNVKGIAFDRIIHIWLENTVH
jgi:acid phosphatase